jgi:uncharacterized membrane protein
MIFKIIGSLLAIATISSAYAACWTTGEIRNNCIYSALVSAAALWVFGIYTSMKGLE